MEEMTFDELKAYADEHGIEHAPNIGEDKLRERVNAFITNDESPPDGPPAPLTVPVTIEKKTTLKYDEPEPPKLASKPKPPALAKAKTLGKTKKQKEIWLATPHMMELTHPQTGEVWLDDAGEPLAIPLLVCATAREAVKLIKKYEAKVEVDEDGLPVTVMGYEPATKEQIDAYLGEMKTKRFFRAKEIKSRQLKKAKHFIGVSKEEVEAATGTKVEL